MKKIIIIFLVCIILSQFVVVNAKDENYKHGTALLPDNYYTECPQQGSVQLLYDGEQYINVYLPVGYQKSNQKYDVFFMLHQAGNGNHSSWIETPVQSYGGLLPLKQVYDWLIYEKKIPPIIVACINLELGVDNRQDIRHAMHWIGDNLKTYANDGSDESLTEARYHFYTGGLSMGAWKGTKCMREDYDIFGNYIFGYGGDVNYLIDDLSKEYAKTHNNKILNNVVIGCGNKDKSFNSNKENYRLLSKYSNKCRFYEFQGGHGFAVAIPFMYDALLFIYKDYKVEIFNQYNEMITNIIKSIEEILHEY